MSSSARMDCIITFKILFKILGTLTLQAFLNEFKNSLTSALLQGGPFHNVQCLLAAHSTSTILAARFWRASRSCLRPSPQQPHTLTQYSKIGLIRLQYTTFALSLVRLLRSLPSIPTRFPAFEIRYFICSFQLRRSSKTIPR